MEIPYAHPVKIYKLTGHKGWFRKVKKSEATMQAIMAIYGEDCLGFFIKENPDDIGVNPETVAEASG